MHQKPFDIKKIVFRQNKLQNIRNLQSTRQETKAFSQTKNFICHQHKGPACAAYLGIIIGWKSNNQTSGPKDTAKINAGDTSVAALVLGPGVCRTGPSRMLQVYIFHEGNRSNFRDHWQKVDASNPSPPTSPSSLSVSVCEGISHFLQTLGSLLEKLDKLWRRSGWLIHSGTIDLHLAPIHWLKGSCAWSEICLRKKFFW